MPLLPAEPCCFPENLFSVPDPGGEEQWWILHTRPRTEKALARSLLTQSVPHFLPTFEHSVRVRGRLQTSHHPLFPGYVFLRADRDGRVKALSTKYVANCLPVAQQERLRAEVSLPDAISPAQKALLSDPQTSGGLLVACSPEAADEVLACFQRHGFYAARQIGVMVEGSGVQVYQNRVQ